jgi:hypothetical protein
MAQTRKIQIDDSRGGERDVSIEILIGGNYYWRIVEDASTKVYLSHGFNPFAAGFLLEIERLLLPTG